MASGLGFEPRLPVPKTGVLPLDDPEILFFAIKYGGKIVTLENQCVYLLLYIQAKAQLKNTT